MECSCTIQKLSIAEEDGLFLFKALAGKLEEEDLLFVSCLARQIWLRRNSYVFGGTLPQPAFLVHSTTEFLADF